MSQKIALEEWTGEASVKSYDNGFMNIVVSILFISFLIIILNTAVHRTKDTSRQSRLITHQIQLSK